MFLNILKKDLKRKKTMNLIILVFVILSSMFFSSSVNNIVSVMGGVDRFLDMAGMKDCVVVVAEPDGVSGFGEMLNESSDIKSYTKETFLLCDAEMLRLNGSAIQGAGSMGIIIPAEDMCTKCFDINNEPITSVEKGKIMLTASLANKAGIKNGDIISIDMYGEKLDLKMAGICKDAILGSEMTDSPKLIISSEDYSQLYSNDTVRKTSRYTSYNIETADLEAVSEIASSSNGCLLNISRSMVKLTFIISISIAAILMAVSVFLIIISFVVLRFTIGFTIQEEFREIGVMKAIGIKNSSIRALYLVKYLGIAVIGAVIGFFASIPFGKMLLDSVSSGMILGNDHPVLIGIICSVFAVGLIMFFCWRYTAKVKKLSPIDAVRNGQTGERFRRHRSMSLGKSRLGTSVFMALNDVFSNPRQSVILTTVFTLCALLVMVLSSTSKTLASDELIYLLGTTKSDTYIDTHSGAREVKSGMKTLSQVEGEIEDTLEENGMPGKVHVESLYNVSVEFEGITSDCRFLYCGDTKCSDYVYGEGTPPRYANEIALGYAAANEIGAKVGDTVTVATNGTKEQFIVTALMDCMSNVGKCGRFHESYEPPIGSLAITMGYQVDFNDHPDKKNITERIEKLKEVYSSNRVFSCSEYVDDSTKAASAVAGIKNLTLIVSLMIIIMLSILIERSFISKEKTEIALEKAIGFGNGAVIRIHVLRFVIITAVSVGIAALLCTPATKLVMDPLFGMLGAVKGLKYDIAPAEMFIIFPLIVLAAVTAGSFITSLSTNLIKASDTSNIE